MAASQLALRGPERVPARKRRHRGEGKEARLPPDHEAPAPAPPPPPAGRWIWRMLPAAVGYVDPRADTEYLSSFVTPARF